MSSDPPSIQRIVLTGGPCAGKSTALERIAAWLHACGVQVYRVPEASTLLLRGGILVAGAPLDFMIAFQRGIVRLQLALEDAFLDFARTQQRHAVLLCDRGVVDGAAYLPTEAWQRIAGATGYTDEQLRDGRYDAVLHLVTTALGAESHYGTHTNAVRYETLDEARAVDLRLRQAWSGHPRHYVIDNSAEFETKLHRVLQAVCEIVGVSAPPRN